MTENMKKFVRLYTDFRMADDYDDMVTEYNDAMGVARAMVDCDNISPDFIEMVQTAICQIVFDPETRPVMTKEIREYIYQQAISIATAIDLAKERLRIEWGPEKEVYQ